MAEDDKIPLFVIGKSANPRCFKHVKTLPVEYTNNKKAWMTGEIFTKWLLKLDKRFQREHRKVAMVVDNCPAHPHVKGLNAIELVFLPPNTTSHTQPCDQGIIKNLKVHYRRQVIMKQLEPFTVSILDALRLLRQSWTMVTETTVSKCFHHAGFVVDVSPDVDYSSDEDDDIPLARLVRVSHMDLRAFIDIDTQLPVWSNTSEEDIVQDIISARNPLETDGDEEEDDVDLPTQPPPSTSDAIAMCDSLRRFFETQADSDSELNALC